MQRSLPRAAALAADSPSILGAALQSVQDQLDNRFLLQNAGQGDCMPLSWVDLLKRTPKEAYPPGLPPSTQLDGSAFRQLVVAHGSRPEVRHARALALMLRHSYARHTDARVHTHVGSLSRHRALLCLTRHGHTRIALTR